MHEAQDRPRGRLHALQMGAAGAGCSAMFPAQLSEELAQTEGKATVRRVHLEQPFGEDTPWTVGLITVELADVQMQDDLHVSPPTDPSLCVDSDYGSDEQGCHTRDKAR